MKYVLIKFEVIYIIKYIFKGENNDIIKRWNKMIILLVYICFVIMCLYVVFVFFLVVDWMVNDIFNGV